MRYREALIHTDVFGFHNDLNKTFPVCTPGASDTARFDEALELRCTWWIARRTTPC